nr:serine/arginine repetitive matrix protein 1-like [Drosophila suzukii]
MPQGYPKDTTQERPEARCMPKDNFQGYSPRVIKKGQNGIGQKEGAQPERTRDEDSAPEPVVSSDSDVEVVGDPAVEEREWRLRKAAAGDRIPRGTTDVGGAELPRGHAGDVCRATEETRKRFRDREPAVEEQQRYAAEEPSPRSEDGAEPCAPSPPRWLPEVPPTPRYEGEWLTEEARESDGGDPLATPPWRPARPPTPRYTEPQRPEERTQTEESTAQPIPQPQEEAVHQAQAQEPSVVRTEVPDAHVSHSTRAFVAEGVRWRQQTLVWTWPEGPATVPTKEEPRIWEEGVPKPRGLPRSRQAHITPRAAPSATAAPSRAHSSANRAGHVVTSHTTSVTRVINSADPAASRAVQCHPRDHQVPTERPPRPPQRPTSALHSAQRAPIERHQCPPWPTAVPSAASAPNAKPYERLPSSRATAVPTERSPHRSALPRVSRATGSAHPRVHQERSPRSPSAIRSASLSSAHRAASAPSVAFSAHQQRPSSGVSAQQAPSAAPTERQSPRPQQRPAAPSAAQPLTSRTHRAPTGAPAATTSVSHCRTSAAPAVRPPHHAPGSAQRPVTPLGALTE